MICAPVTTRSSLENDFIILHLANFLNGQHWTDQRQHGRVGFNCIDGKKFQVFRITYEDFDLVSVISINKKIIQIQFNFCYLFLNSFYDEDFLSKMNAILTILAIKSCVPYDTIVEYDNFTKLYYFGVKEEKIAVGKEYAAHLIIEPNEDFLIMAGSDKTGKVCA